MPKGHYERAIACIRGRIRGATGLSVTDQQTTPNSAHEAGDATATEAQQAVGQLLRETREKAGLDLADVARVLRISQRYLEALEDGRNADLPGATYAIGFVRSYAEHLHLDGEEIVRRYKAQAEGVGAKTDLVFPKPIPDSGVPGAAVLGLGVIVAAVAYGVWYWNSMQADVAIDRVEPVPEHLAAAPQAPEAAPAPTEPAETSVNELVSAPAPEMTPDAAEDIQESVAEAVQDTQAEATAEAVADTAAVAQETAEAAPETLQEAAQDTAVQTETAVSQAVQEDAAAAESAMSAVGDAAPEAVAENAPAAVQDAAQDAAKQVAAEQTAQVDEEPAAEAEAAADETVQEVAAVQPEPGVDGPSRITVRAKSNSWIQVRDEALDRLLFTRLLREGDEYEVPNRPGLHLMTGNAGALELVVDGEVAPAIGAVGEVRRNVELDPEKLKSGTAVAE